jgi:hypothetical protein
MLNFNLARGRTIDCQLRAAHTQEHGLTLCRLQHCN